MQTNVMVDDAPYGTTLAMADPDMDRADIFREAMTVYVRPKAEVCPDFINARYRPRSRRFTSAPFTNFDGVQGNSA
jgi:hypothetical protein